MEFLNVKSFDNCLTIVYNVIEGQGERMKKFIVFFLVTVFLIMPATGHSYTVENAYDEVMAKHPDFIEKLSTQNITREMLIEFITDAQKFMNELNEQTKITEENFEKNALSAVITVSSEPEHLKIQDALIILFPSAVKQVFKTGTIPEEFKPLTDTIKRIVFDNKMLGEAPSGMGNTDGVHDSTENRFTDVDSSFWGYTAICTLADNFILNGYLDKTFRPNESITRAEFAKIIVSAAGTFDAMAKTAFSDVSEEDWFYSYVASAVEKGYIKGYPDNTFSPNEKITRADLCTVVYRCIKDKLKAADAISFSDDNMIPPYAKEGVYALSANQIVNGMGEGIFAPLMPATRAQTAKIIYTVFFEKFKN